MISLANPLRGVGEEGGVLQVACGWPTLAAWRNLCVGGCCSGDREGVLRWEGQLLHAPKLPLRNLVSTATRDFCLAGISS